MIKKTIFCISFLFFIFMVYFSLVHFVVYGKNYDAIITNAHIIINKPHCISTFLSPEDLKKKFSYKLYEWVAINKIDPAVSRSDRRVILVPDELLRDYFNEKQGSDFINDELSCEFISQRLKDPSSRYYSYKYKRESIFFGGLGDRKVEIFMGFNDDKLSSVFARVYWGY